MNGVHIFVMKKRCVICFCLWLVLQLSAANVCAATSGFGEYDLQAGYIYKFISFVQWPEEKVPADTLTIGVLGKDPFGDAFESLQGKSVGTRFLRIKKFDGDVDYEVLNQCQILYISSSEDGKLSSILQSLENVPVLTISDSKQFIDHGGMVGFVKKKNKVVFEINNAATSKAGMVVRSMLKRLAFRVIDKDPVGSGWGRDFYFRYVGYRSDDLRTAVRDPDGVIFL
jgi:hypothetical protein